MGKLTHRTTKQVFEFLRQLYVLRSGDDLTTHLVGTIPSLILTDIGSCNDMNSRRRHVVCQMPLSDQSLTPDTTEIPVTHGEHTKDLTARNRTDSMAQHQVQTTELYNALDKPFQIPNGMDTGLSVGDERLIIIDLNLGGRGLSEEKSAVLNLLRPHVVQAFGNAETITRLRKELSTLNQAMEELRRGLLSVTPKGRILWATTEANRLLDAYGLRGDRRSEWLPSPLREWTNRELERMGCQKYCSAPSKPLVIEYEDSMLTVRLLKEGWQVLLSLEECRAGCTIEELAPLGLSPRETEILFWVVKGKTNPEIGMILGISPRTVQKHLERVYGRLGVENRHAAIHVALSSSEPS